VSTKKPQFSQHSLWGGTIQCKGLLDAELFSKIIRTSVVLVLFCPTYIKLHYGMSS